MFNDFHPNVWHFSCQSNFIFPNANRYNLQFNLLSRKLKQKCANSSSPGLCVLEKNSHSFWVTTTSWFSFHVCCEQFCLRDWFPKRIMVSVQIACQTLSAHIVTPVLVPIFLSPTSSSAGNSWLQMVGWTYPNIRNSQTEGNLVILNLQVFILGCHQRVDPQQGLSNKDR